MTEKEIHRIEIVKGMSYNGLLSQVIHDVAISAGVGRRSTKILTKLNVHSTYDGQTGKYYLVFTMED